MVISYDDVFIVILLVGNIGNILSISIIATNPSINATDRLLIVQTFVDILCLDFIFLINALMYYLDWFFLTESDITCKLWYFTSVSLLHIDAWILILINVQRIITLKFPDKFSTWFTNKRVHLYVTFVFGSALLIDSHFLFTATKNDNSRSYEKCMSPTFSSLVIIYDLILGVTIPQITSLAFSTTLVIIFISPTDGLRQQKQVTQDQKQQYHLSP